MARTRSPALGDLRVMSSTVDNSLVSGIGRRLVGWPNPDLNPGANIALSPALRSAVKAVYNFWGKGKYDARFNLDGKSVAAVIPPAYGLNGVYRRKSPIWFNTLKLRSPGNGLPGFCPGLINNSSR